VLEKLTDMKVKLEMSVIWLALKILQRITISMESSQRDLFIDIVVDRFIFKNNQRKLFPRFTPVAKKGVGLPKTGVSF